MSFGAHLSIAGGLHVALEEASKLKMDCVQIFTKNQRQWRVMPLDPGHVEAWHDARKAHRWHLRSGPARVVSHNSYLINLASPERANWERSVKLQRVEVERCETLAIPYLVSHPGAHLGPAPKSGTPHDLDRAPSRAELAGLRRIARALDRIHRELPGFRTITCLETTTGSGSNLGYAFHHLATIRDMIREPERVGCCLDTCHVLAAGYDVSTEAKATEVLREFDRVCGRGTLRVLHLNDSVGECASRLDRHAHIGHGHCGIGCFRAIVNRRSLARVPKILETPKGDNDRGESWDRANLRRLKGLMRRPIRSR